MQIILLIFTVNSENFDFAEGKASKIRLSRAMAQVTIPTAVARVRSQGTSVSPAISHSTKCSISIHYPGLVQLAN